MRHFGCFFHDNFQPEVASDAISGANVGLVSLDVIVKFGDSRSNRSGDMHATASLVMKDDDDTGVRQSSHKGAFCLTTNSGQSPLAADNISHSF